MPLAQFSQRGHSPAAPAQGLRKDQRSSPHLIKVQGVVAGSRHHQLQQPDHAVRKPVLQTEITLLERDAEADGPSRHPHTQAEQAIPLRAVPHQVGADGLPLQLGVGLPNGQRAPVEVTGLEDVEGSLQDLPLTTAKHPEAIGQTRRCGAGENAPMLPLQTSNSGACVLQIIWPPSDHLSKSPWIPGRRCIYHAFSVASSLQERSRVRQIPTSSHQASEDISQGGKLWCATSPQLYVHQANTSRRDSSWATPVQGTRLHCCIHCVHTSHI